MGETVILYSNGNIINNASIIDTTFVGENGYYNDGSGAVTNTGGYLKFVPYPNANQQWRNSYIRTGITISTNDSLEFKFKSSLDDYETSTASFTAPRSGELLLCFDCVKWDSIDTRNSVNRLTYYIWDTSTPLPNTTSSYTDGIIEEHDLERYPRYVTRPTISLEEIILSIN